MGSSSRIDCATYAPYYVSNNMSIGFVQPISMKNFNKKTPPFSNYGFDVGGVQRIGRKKSISPRQSLRPRAHEVAPWSNTLSRVKGEVGKRDHFEVE